jgi:hypothetical protein
MHSLYSDVASMSSAVLPRHSLDEPFLHSGMQHEYNLSGQEDFNYSGHNRYSLL